MATQWPPRSPHEALLGTPGGRERMRRLAERESPSPSPSKLRISRPAAALNSRNGGNGASGGGGLDDPFEGDLLFEGEEEEDDDDEEMLQLKLQAIQARLKLKKLQAAKAQKKTTSTTASSSETNGRGMGSSTRNAASAQQGLPVQSKLAAARDRMERPPNHNSVQVPASPVRKAQPPADLQTSPQRVLLGIDKGRRAADMSLKRAPSLRAQQDDNTTNQQGGYLRRSRTVPGQVGQAEAACPQSFNERLASSRAEETSRQEKQQRIKQIRTKAFSIGKQEMEEYKTKAVSLPDIPYKAPEYTRNDILAGKPHGLQRSSTAPALQSRAGSSQDDPFATTGSANSSMTNPSESEASFESYSGLHLSKRVLPHRVLARAITGKKTYVLKDLLRHVKAPDWSLPDVESDVVVFAIIANKSDPKSHRPGPTNATKDRGKYMVINLVDLTYEVDLFLFNSGFDRFWKLTPGTVLAILNPTIMPPPQGREDTGRFGLVINSDEDTILEIGSARDLGYCKSVKKDGALCSSWVNVRRSEYCEFHTNEAVRKAREGRFEMNQTFLGGGVAERYKKNSKEVYGFDGKGSNKYKSNKSEVELQRGRYDRSTQSHFFVSSAHSTAELMDDEKTNGFADRVEREEGLKRRLAQKEKERNIAKKLAEIGGGAGKEYMSRAAAAVAAAPTSSSALGSRRGKQQQRGLGGLGSSISSAATLSSAAGGSGSGSGGATVSTSMSSFSTNSGGGGAAAVEPASLPGQGHRWDARALGLVGRRGEDGQQHRVELGPIKKRKRPESSASNSTSGGGSGANNGGAVEVGEGGGGGGNKGGGVRGVAYGWGSELRTKLGRMKEGERLDGVRSYMTAATTAVGGDEQGGGGIGGSSISGKIGGAVSLPPPRLATVAAEDSGSSSTGRNGTQSPVRKKTRFVTERGIREAGRESLGEPLSAAAKRDRQVVLDDDDDDDDLIVVK